MDQEPYRSAKRVFCIIDKCSVHRGQKCVQRLQARWPSIVPVHTPNHASWLNQVEIYFSVVQRKVLTPNDFHSLAQLEERYWPSSNAMRSPPLRSSGPSTARIWQSL